MFDLPFFELLLGSREPELARRYVEVHPPPAEVMTPEEAAVRIAASSSASQIPRPGPWYGNRHRLRLTCAQEYRLESSGFLRHYM